MAPNNYRTGLVDRLRVEAAAADTQLVGITGVVAEGIRHLARLCTEAADELERSQATKEQP